MEGGGRGKEENEGNEKRRWEERVGRRGSGREEKAERGGREVMEGERRVKVEPEGR